MDKAPIKLWKGTRLSTLLLVHPEAIDALVAFTPALTSMRNSEVRTIQAHRLTLEDVAALAGKPVDELLQALQEIVGDD